MEFNEKLQEHTYVHPRFQPNTIVRVKEDILNIHEKSPLAGKTIQVCEGTYYSSSDPDLQRIIDREEKERHHLTKVPVWFEEEVWLVEEEYVEHV